MRTLSLLVLLVGCTDELRDPPELASIEPDRGLITGHELVTIRGANLNEVVIEIGGVECTQVASGTSVASCWTGEGVAGASDVIVIGEGGSTTLVGAYVYECPKLAPTGRCTCGPC
ncbi:MAG: IPT/TIG domain-containing protein [Kofleriaceae bacterium]